MRKLLSELTFDHGKCLTQKTHACTFTFMRVPVEALPKVQNRFQMKFFPKVLYNLCSKVFLKCFGQY